MTTARAAARLSAGRRVKMYRASTRWLAQCLALRVPECNGLLSGGRNGSKYAAA
jgi:hypothetical protein